MTTETVGGRSVLRYRGEPVTHDVHWRGTRVGEANYPGGMVGDCDCGQLLHVVAGYTTERLARADRMHGGTEDP